MKRHHIRLLFVFLLSNFCVEISYAQRDTALILECADKAKNNLSFRLEINLTSNTFNAFRNGDILERFDVPLKEITSERILMYESFGGRPMYVDRVNGTFSSFGTVYPCTKVQTAPKKPQF